MKSQGFSQTPQDIMEEYNGCSVPQYTAYPLLEIISREVLDLGTHSKLFQFIGVVRLRFLEETTGDH